MVIKLPARYVFDILNQIVSRDDNRAVVLPLNRIADLWCELLELDKRLLLGFISHPVKALNALLVGLNQKANQLIHAVLGSWREVLFNIDLSNGFAK